LLHIKDLVKKFETSKIDEALKEDVNRALKLMSEAQIIAGIKGTLTELLDGSDNKNKKIELLQKNVLDNQKVKALKQKDWIEIIDSILMDIYKYIDTNSSEGQDILNLFFIAFNKYTGKADKNQAFTPDHITEFMCRLTEVDCTKVVLDGTCGSASFLVQAMVKELADCDKPNLISKQIEKLKQNVKKNNIYGIEVEEKAHTKEEVVEVDKGIHFVSRTDCNNGVDITVDKDTRYEGLEEANCITIGDTTATVFYQNERFIAGDHMVVLRANWLNLKRGLFFRTLFAQEGIRYCYGRAYRMDLIKSTLLKLPIKRDNSGNPVIDDNRTYSDKGYIPDWQFMEDYINSLPYSDRI